MSEMMSRRTFARLLGAGATAAAALPSVASSETSSVMQQHSGRESGRLDFPSGFIWGSATASYQVEGAPTEDGKGTSIWDVFSHIPGKIYENQNADVADDDYHRYREDISLMKEIGLKAARFSISWPRIFPNGTGSVNQAGLDHYRKAVDDMLENGIVPFCTLYHWDLPQALQEKGGWENPDTARAFADYAGAVTSKLSDRVHNWMTMNEISSFTQAGYGYNLHAPGLHVGRKRLAQLTHYAVWGHGLGFQAIRAHANGPVKVGLADNPSSPCPVLATEEHIAAAERAFQEENAQFLNVILTGRYTDLYLKRLSGDAPSFTSEEMKVIAAPLDFVGLNVYTPKWIRADNSQEQGYRIVANPANYPHMDPSWIGVGPEALYWTPIIAQRLYSPKVLYITENGAAAQDFVAPDGHVWDTGRTMYLRNYLSQLHRAIQAGAPVAGYFLWSLFDNFEWADGFKSRFGITYVDFETQKRTMKLSAYFYKDVIANNGVA